MLQKIYRSEENLDEYEYDDDDQEEQFVEEGYEEEEEEEEDPKPSKEELEYLEIRQKLKEALRKQVKKENGSFGSKSQEKKNRLPYDNYGSFFGPSQPAISQRVIQERKSLLETQHLAARTSNTHNTSGKSYPLANSGTRPGVNKPQMKIVDQAKLKAQKLKDLRDYSFLLSDDAELPAPAKELPQRNISVPKPAVQSAHGPPKNKQPVSNGSKAVSNGFQERKLLHTNRQMHAKPAQNKVTPQSRHSMTSADPRRLHSSSSGNANVRPMGSKVLASKMAAPSKFPCSSKMSAPTMDKKASSMGVKRPISSVQKPPLPASHSSVQKRPLEQKRVLHQPDRPKPRLQQPDRPKPMSKPAVSTSKPQIKPPPKQIPSRPPAPLDRPKKRPSRPFFDDDDDEDDPQAIIRKMFGYDPRKYAGVDEDDSNMEANFDDILEEEQLSSIIAMEEDERELKLIEEEERRERLRKAAKKRKLSQR